MGLQDEETQILSRCYHWLNFPAFKNSNGLSSIPYTTKFFQPFHTWNWCLENWNRSCSKSKSSSHCLFLQKVKFHITKTICILLGILHNNKSSSKIQTL